MKGGWLLGAWCDVTRPTFSSHVGRTKFGDCENLFSLISLLFYRKMWNSFPECHWECEHFKFLDSVKQYNCFQRSHFQKGERTKRPSLVCTVYIFDIKWQMIWHSTCILKTFLDLLHQKITLMSETQLGCQKLRYTCFSGAWPHTRIRYAIFRYQCQWQWTRVSMNWSRGSTFLLPICNIYNSLSFTRPVTRTIQNA